MAKTDGTINIVFGPHLYNRFAKIAKAHFTTPENVLLNYALDYIVSGGFPEKGNTDLPEIVKEVEIQTQDILAEAVSEQSNYVFYVSEKYYRKYVSKRNVHTNEFFTLRPFHSNRLALGWVKHQVVDFSCYSEVPETIAKQSIRSFIKIMEQDLDVQVEEERIERFIQLLCEGERRNYTLESAEKQNNKGFPDSPNNGIRTSSNYSFYTISDISIVKKNRITNKYLKLIAFHDKDGALGWAECQFNPSQFADVSEDSAKTKIKELVVDLADYCEVSLSLKRLNELVQALLDSEESVYHLESDEDRKNRERNNRRKLEDQLNQISRKTTVRDGVVSEKE